jgi:transcriptional regulator with XRE-family HTH domain
MMFKYIVLGGGVMEKIKEISERIKGLRQLLDFSQEEMAKAADVSVEEYNSLENGEMDFSVTFVFKCAQKFGVDVIEILKGTSPTLKTYSIVRKGEGLPTSRRKGFEYLHLAPFFKDKKLEPFWVVAKYGEEEQNKDIVLSRHAGQEMDIIIKGSLKIQIDDHIEILNEGDTIIYDSGRGHGMIATGGSDCEFVAILL